MSRQYVLNEDKLPPKLLVKFSKEIDKKIDDIYDCNQNNVNGLRKWFKYLDEIKDYLSNTVIAFDYTDRYRRFPNGTIFIDDFDYNVGYTIKTYKNKNQAVVYVFMVNLNPQKFGLKDPFTNTPKSAKAIDTNISIDRNGNYVAANGHGADYVSENTNRVKRTIRLNESDFKRLINESVRMVLKERRNRRLDESIDRNIRRVLREHISKAVRT